VSQHVRRNSRIKSSSFSGRHPSVPQLGNRLAFVVYHLPNLPAVQPAPAPQMRQQASIETMDWPSFGLDLTLTRLSASHNPSFKVYPLPFEL
jgi:hypothetical protein